VEAKINILKCKKCGKFYLPPMNSCSNCEEISTGFLEEEVEGRGKIYSFTVVRIPPKRYKDLAPFILAIIELENGLRLMGRIICNDFNKVEINKPVKLLPCKDPQYCFELIE